FGVRASLAEDRGAAALLARAQAEGLAHALDELGVRAVIHHVGRSEVELPDRLPRRGAQVEEPHGEAAGARAIVVDGAGVGARLLGLEERADALADRGLREVPHLRLPQERHRQALRQRLGAAVGLDEARVVAAELLDVGLDVALARLGLAQERLVALDELAR